MEAETIVAKGMGVLAGLLAVAAFAGAMLAGWGVAHHAIRIMSGYRYDDAPDRPWRKESCTAAIIQTIAIAFLWMGLVVLTGGRQLGLDRDLSISLAVTWFSAGGVFSGWAIMYVLRSWKRGPLHEALDRPGWLSLQFSACLLFGLTAGLVGIRLFLG